MATAAQILAEIDTAIIEILQGAQEATVQGRSYRKADLATLDRMRERYASLVNQITNSIWDRMKTAVPYRG